MTISLTRTRTYGRVERKGRSMMNSKVKLYRRSRGLGTIGGVKADTKAWFVFCTQKPSKFIQCLLIFSHTLNMKTS